MKKTSLFLFIFLTSLSINIFSGDPWTPEGIALTAAQKTAMANPITIFGTQQLRDQVNIYNRAFAANDVAQGTDALLNISRAGFNFAESNPLRQFLVRKNIVTKVDPDPNGLFAALQEKLEDINKKGPPPPTKAPTKEPTKAPTKEPKEPIEEPTKEPTKGPTKAPTKKGGRKLEGDALVKAQQAVKNARDEIAANKKAKARIEGAPKSHKSIIDAINRLNKLRQTEGVYADDAVAGYLKTLNQHLEGLLFAANPNRTKLNNVIAAILDFENIANTNDVPNWILIAKRLAALKTQQNEEDEGEESDED